MGLADLIAKKRETQKFQAKVIKVTDINKIAAEDQKVKEEEKTSRLGASSEKTSWISKKKDEAAEWASEASDAEEDYLTRPDPPKVTEEPTQEESKPKVEAYPSLAEAKAWNPAAASTQVLTNEASAAEPGAFIPTALKHAPGVRPKLQDAMEFPTLEVASKEETVKPKIEVEADAGPWKTAGRQDPDYNSYGAGSYRSRNFDDFSRGPRRRERDQGEFDGDWSRGKVMSSNNESMGRRPMMNRPPADDSCEFVRGAVVKASMDSRPTSNRPYRPPAASEESSWTRGNVVNASNASEYSRFAPSQTASEMREEAKEKELRLQHRNRFEALSELE